jgi:hypothetical protein
MNSSRPKTRSRTREKWLILGIDRNRRTIAVRVAKGSPVGTHAARLADPDRTDCEFVFVVGPEVEPLLETSLDDLIEMMQGARRPALILLPWTAPPEWGLRFDGQVRSFVCGRAIFRSLLARSAERPVEGLCFALLDGIMNQRLAVDRLAVRQLPFANGPAKATGRMTGQEACPTKASLIMAHHGRRQHLSTALRYISLAIGPNVRARIGLDEDDPTAYASVAAHYPEAQFFRLVPAGAGPYVVRQELARRSKEPLLVFHDSDDISCYDRFVVQEELLRSAGCDLVGCHEMRIDEMEKEVTAIRFPLDVTASLKAQGGHRLWHPTTMVRREAFWSSGGFSTDRKIANDTQFLLRAHFGMKIRNLDGFVYLRRKHRSALTVAPGTALDHPIRLQLSKQWLRDFEAVKRGEMRIEESSLWPVAGTARHRLYRMRHGE